MVPRRQFRNFLFWSVTLSNIPVLKRISGRDCVGASCLHETLIGIPEKVDMRSVRTVLLAGRHIAVVGRDSLLQQESLERTFGSQSVMMIRVGPAPAFQQQVGIRVMPGEGIVKSVLMRAFR